MAERAGDTYGRRAFCDFEAPWPQDVLAPKDLRRMSSRSIPFECQHGISVWCDCCECEAAQDRARDDGYLWTAGGLLALVGLAVGLLAYLS